MQAYAWALLNGKILIRTLRQYGILFVCCFLVSVHCLVFYKSLNSRNCVFTIFLQKASQPRVFSFCKYSAVVCLYENFLPHAWVSGFSRHTMKFSSSGRFDYFMRSNSRRRYSSNFRQKCTGEFRDSKCTKPEKLLVPMKIDSGFLRIVGSGQSSFGGR